MAVRLGLQRHGRNKQPFYRIVARENTSPRDGRYKEIIGTYDCICKPVKVLLKQERAEYWLRQGAKPTPAVQKILKEQLPGVFEGLEEHRLDKVKEARKKRKERITERGGDKEREARKERRDAKQAKKAEAAAKAAERAKQVQAEAKSQAEAEPQEQAEEASAK